MDINPALYGAQSGTAALGEMSALQDYQTKSQLAPIAIHDAQTASRLGDVKAGQDQAAAANAALAQVARDAQAADPEDAPGIWDAGMKKAASAGATVASQYVGHYRPDLAERVGSAYGGAQGAAAAPGAGGAPDPAMVQSAVAQMPAPQLSQALGNLNRVITSFNGVRDEESWNNEMQSLREAGIDVSKFLPNMDWNPMNYAAASRMVKNLVPYRDAMATRAALTTSGVSTPTIPREVKEVGGVLYSVSPFGTDATPLTKPTPSYSATQALGPDGRPIVIDKTTGLPPPAGNSLVDFATRVTAAENPGGNPAQPNVWGGSSAIGNGQFLNGTWLSLMKSAHPELTKGKSDAEILAMRSNPTLSASMIQTYATQNADALHKAGLPVTTATLYLAHGFGPDGAAKILEAPVNTPVSSILPAKVITANPYLKNMTAGQLAQQFAGKVGNDPVDVGGGGAQGANVPGNTQLHGEDYLKSIPDPTFAAQVRAVIQGRTPPITGFSWSKPAGQRLVAAAAQYDPNFDLTLFKSREATQTDLAKGTMGKNVTSFNTAIGHADRLDRHIDALGNSTYFPAFINPARAAVLSQIDPQYQRARADFDTDKNALVEELTRAFKGTGGSLTEVLKWEEKLNEAASPEALHAAVREAMALLGSRIEATGDQYNRGMRMTVAPTSLLNAPARAAFARLTGIGGSGQKPGGGSPPAGATQSATNPQTGQKMYLVGGKWVSG